MQVHMHGHHVSLGFIRPVQASYTQTLGSMEVCVGLGDSGGAWGVQPPHPSMHLQNNQYDMVSV